MQTTKKLKEGIFPNLKAKALPVINFLRAAPLLQLFWVNYVDVHKC